MTNAVTFEEQTEKIVEVLFYDLIHGQSGICFRGLQTKPNVGLQLQGLRVKTVTLFTFIDSLVTPAGTFDPVPVARTLQHLGDQYNEEIETTVQGILQEKNMDPLCSQLKKFRETIEQLSRNSGLEYELSFLAVAVKLFQCLAQNAPTVVEPDLLIQTINGNPEVRGYIERQGGWENFGNRGGQNNP